MSAPVDPLPVQPFIRPLAGARVRLPGSKSLTNRALILAALAQGTVTLEDALFSRDSRLLCEALRALGLEIEADPAARTIRVQGLGGHLPAAKATLEVGNSGTTARFLTALVATREGGSYHFDGDTPMRQRPMKGLLDALAAQGARFTFHGQAGHFPFTLEPGGLAGGTVHLDAGASSQLLSGLLMAAPFAREGLTIHLDGPTVSAPFVTMTTRLMRQWGATFARETRDAWKPILGGPYRIAGGRYRIEPDATAASYFLALPVVVGGTLEIIHFPHDSLQGDAGFADVMQAAGLARLHEEGDSLHIRRGAGAGPLDEDFNAISDTFLTLAALAPLLEGPTTIRAIGHTRHQETDRIAAMETELARLGQRVSSGADWLRIEPDREALRAAAANGPVPIETYDDHRVAMSFGVLGCHDLLANGRPWVAIRDPDCCGKTFPDFFQKLEALRAGRDAT
jgi:3-phosphoshikimate 1-carboxyvinyltransferase